ncbi:hypothetical protein like AT3G06240 [Hibiscus trionum]|uniref:F-box domain-containing protein n=1 Tax=Hibiscus trionum TaxID=183268 RepID=A0A9W7LIP8_HIBTR|nr:hypothetical protein like AT3G06240 [Hibiscus trionum]
MQRLSKTRTELPEMLVLDILSKLPVESLIRFKCVCKSWSSSFQTPFFITQHHHSNLRNNNLNLLLQRCNGNTYLDLSYFSRLSTEKGQNFSLKQNIQLPFSEYFSHELTVQGPRNGILCLEFGDNICLWNPSTREYKILPQSPIQRPPSVPPSVSNTSFGCVGFGYDSQTDDYKVLRFVINSFSYYYDGVNIYSHAIQQVDLYSLKGNSWKEISHPGVNAHYATLFDIYVNGFYYWHATEASGFIILSFDMVNERFSTLPLPEFDEGFDISHHLELLNFNELLGAIVYPREGTLKSFDILVMSGSWTKLFSIESVPGVERPLGFWKNGELFLESSDDELVLFDPSTRGLKNLGFHAYKGTMHIIAYAESLVPLNGRVEHGELVLRRPVGGPSS